MRETDEEIRRTKRQTDARTDRQRERERDRDRAIGIGIGRYIDT